MNQDDSSSDKIKTIRPGISKSPNKQQFLDVVAEAFDNVCENSPGGEPIGVMFSLINAKGEAQTGYIALSHGCERLYVAALVANIMAKLPSWLDK